MDLANVQREELYDIGDLGRDKVVAFEDLTRLNPDCRITPVFCRLEDDELDVLAAPATSWSMPATTTTPAQPGLFHHREAPGLGRRRSIRGPGHGPLPRSGACYASLYPEIADLPERCADTASWRRSSGSSAVCSQWRS